MTIDELLERHPAPWTATIEGPMDADGCEVNPHDWASLDDIETINAYAALKLEKASWSKIGDLAISELKAEADNLRACVKAADEMRSCETVEWRAHRGTAEILDAYDAARAKVKP